MRNDDEDGLSKHTLNLYPGDYEKLRELFPDVGAAAIIRRIVRRHIEHVEATGSKSIDPKVEIKI